MSRLAMANVMSPLPEFAHPPIIETVLGVEFSDLEGWAIPHFGLFWEQIRGDYPKFEVHPSLSAPNEPRGAEDRLLQAMLFRFVSEPPVRCWYLDAEKNRLLQVQSDRFIHNWRKNDSGDAYMRYDVIKPLFEKEWLRYVAFLDSERLPCPAPEKCEVTYVNHLLKGREWDTLDDLARIFPACSGYHTIKSIGSPEAAAINLRIPIMNKSATLTIQVQPASRQADKLEILQMTLSAKGVPASPDLTGILDWFDRGRVSVVQAFNDFTSAEMHALWGKQS